jgi:hypothetical protein
MAQAGQGLTRPQTWNAFPSLGRLQRQSGAGLAIAREAEKRVHCLSPSGADR